jgi:hypothetical protein
MILAMAGPCRFDWQAVCLTYRGFADFFADFAQVTPPAGLFICRAALHRSPFLEEIANVMRR